MTTITICDTYSYYCLLLPTSFGIVIPRWQRLEMKGAMCFNFRISHFWSIVCAHVYVIIPESTLNNIVVIWVCEINNMVTRSSFGTQRTNGSSSDIGPCRSSGPSELL